MKKQLFSTRSPVSGLPCTRAELDAKWRECEERWRRDDKTRLKPAGLLGPHGESAKHLVTLCVPIFNLGRPPLWHHKRCEAQGESVRGCNVFVIGTLATIAMIFVSAIIGLAFGRDGFFAGALIGLCLRLFLNDGLWGHFRTEEKEGYLLLNYDVRENSWLHRVLRRIRDHVLATDDPNVVIGKFHVMFRGRERFLFYFFLSRIKEEDNPPGSATKAS